MFNKLLYQLLEWLAMQVKPAIDRKYQRGSAKQYIVERSSKLWKVAKINFYFPLYLHTLPTRSKLSSNGSSLLPTKTFPDEKRSSVKFRMARIIDQMSLFPYSLRIPTSQRKSKIFLHHLLNFCQNFATQTKFYLYFRGWTVPFRLFACAYWTSPQIYEVERSLMHGSDFKRLQRRLYY